MTGLGKLAGLCVINMKTIAPSNACDTQALRVGHDDELARMQSFMKGLSFRVLAACAMLGMGVVSSGVSLAQTLPLVPPGGQNFSLSCPAGPDVEFVLDTNSGAAVVSVTGIAAGGNVLVTTAFSGTGQANVQITDETGFEKANTLTGNNSDEITAVGTVSPRSLTFTKQSNNQNTMTVTVSCDDPGGGDFSLTLDKTTTTPTFTAAGNVLSYSYLLTNTGTETLYAPFTIDDDKTTDEACLASPTSLASGASFICSATYEVTLADFTAGFVTNLATATAKSSDSSESVTVTSNTDTVTINRGGSDEDLVKEAFESLSYNFIAQRLNLLASNGPRLARLVNRLDGGFGGGTNGLNVVGENGDITGNFAFSSGALRNAVAGARAVPTADAPRSAGGVNAWIEGQFAVYSDDRKDEDAKGDFFVGYTGIDVEVMERVNIGIMGEIDWMNEDGDDDAHVEGTGWMIGPYLSAEIADGLFLDMRAMRGWTDNSISQAVLGIDYDGDFKTDRWLAEATLSGDYKFDEVTLTPDLRLLHIGENQEDYKVRSNGSTVDVDGKDVILTQLSGGLRISRMIEADDMLFRPYVAGRLFWNIDNPGELTIDGKYISTDDVRGAITLGLDAGSDAMQFGIEGTYDGLFGDNDHALSGRLSFGYRF